MTATLIILTLTVVMFVIGKVRSDVVALCSLSALLVLGILTPAEAFAGFSSTVVIMMVGLFVVGGAIFQTGLAKAASQRIMRLAGGSDMRLFLLVVIVTACIGAFVSNTGTVALMMPIVVSMAAGAGVRPARLLMPLAFASSMGGMLTLIGTPPNLVIQEALTNAGYEPLKFFSFLPVGLICVAVGIIVMLPLCNIFLNKKKSAGKNGGRKGSGKTLSELVDEYRIGAEVECYQITAKSAVKGMSVAQLDLRNKYGITILEIRNEKSDRSGILRNVTQRLASPDHKLEVGDILYMQGEKSRVEGFAADTLLRRIDNSQIDFYDLGIAEIVLMPGSKLIGVQIRNSGFRERYSINVLAVKRGNDGIITHSLPEEKLKSGDVLLVQGTWDNISQLDNEETDWVVLGQPEKRAQQVMLNYKAPMAALIMAAMVAAMVFDFIPIAPVTAIVIAALLMVLTGCFRSVEAAYKTINWESIILIAAMMPMSVALEKTGTSALISHSLVSALGAMGPTVLLCGLYFTTSLLTMFISNTATAVLMAPIAMTSAVEIGASPYPFLFAVTLGASMCFASPFATPPNALVMHAGEYTFSDYIKVGLPLQIIMGIVMTFILPLLFPF